MPKVLLPGTPHRRCARSGGGLSVLAILVNVTLAIRALAQQDIASPDPVQAQLIESHRIHLSWADPSNHKAAFEIERRVGSGPFEMVARTQPGVTLYHDLVAVRGVSRTYRIRAEVNSQSSGYSKETTITPPLPTPGRLVSWGDDEFGQVGRTPSGSDFIAVSAGAHFSVALRSDGTVVAWGRNDEGQVTTAPKGNDFVQIEAGDHHCVALRADGRVVAWGLNSYRQVGDAPRGGGFVKVSAGGVHSLALRADGTLVYWGDHGEYRQWEVPDGIYLDADCGDIGNAAVRADGSLVYWGYQSGESKAPAGHDFVRVLSGTRARIGIRPDGSLVAWGSDLYSHIKTGMVMGAPIGAGFIGVAERMGAAIAIRADGWLVPWGRTGGDTHYRPLSQTPDGGGFQSVSVGGGYVTALRASPPPRGGGFADGGLESPALAPATVLFSDGMDYERLSRWSAAGDRRTVITTGQFLGLPPAEGNQWVEFNAHDAPVGGAVFQTVDTVAGRRYNLRFVVGKSGRGRGWVGIRAEIVSAGDKILEQAIQRATNTGWLPPTTMAFTAESSATTLRFTDVSSDTFSVNAALDAVSLTAEPGR